MHADHLHRMQTRAELRELLSLSQPPETKERLSRLEMAGLDSDLLEKRLQVELPLQIGTRLIVPGKEKVFRFNNTGQAKHGGWLFVENEIACVPRENHLELARRGSS